MNDPNRCRAAEDVSYYLHTNAYKTVQPLIVDDFITTPVTTQNAVGLFETMEAREGRTATLITSLLEPNMWHLRIEASLAVPTRHATGTAGGRLAVPLRLTGVTRWGYHSRNSAPAVLRITTMSCAAHDGVNVYGASGPDMSTP